MPGPSLRLGARHQKRELLWADWAGEELLEDVPHRQVVFSVTTGAVGFVQTAGELLNFHPHVHVLVTDGGFLPDGTFRPGSLSSNEQSEASGRRTDGVRPPDPPFYSKVPPDRRISCAD